MSGIYAISGLATNLGANPAFDAVELSQIPTRITNRLLTVNGLSFYINMAITAYGLWACFGIAKSSMYRSKAKETKPLYSTHLALALMLTTLAAVGVFIATKHYYAVDARYLGISLFAIFVAIASFGQDKRRNPIGLMALSAVLMVSIGFGCVNAVMTYKASHQALSEIDRRNTAVAQAMKKHKVSTLLGDYWRVLPIKSVSGGSLPVTPLQNCVQPRGVLSSQVWQKNLHNHSFAYLLSFDRSLTDYPQCTLDQVISHYGRPNVSTLIAGTLSEPEEVLMFYDDGIRPTTSIIYSAQLFSTALAQPISLNDLPSTSCDGPSIMNIVAHQDDDLLFMSPDLLRSVKEGNCLRTIYMTAGDAGSNFKYVLSREQGSEAAYNSMLGKDYVWDQQIVKLNDNRLVTIASPRGDSKISLIFMRLPDGNLRGEGFDSSRHESLAHLADGRLDKMRTVDNQSVYSSAELVKTLTTLTRTFKPTELRTQSSFAGSEFPDHSDHRAVSYFAKQAHGIYQKEEAISLPIKFYLGYPIHALSDNVTPDELAAKVAAFLAYAKFDSGVCDSQLKCRQSPTYGSYLARQYNNPY